MPFSWEILRPEKEIIEKVYSDDTTLVLHRKPCICDNLLMCQMQGAMSLLSSHLHMRRIHMHTGMAEI